MSVRRFAPFIAALVIAACGGGSHGGGNRPQPQQPQAQTISFAQSGDIYKFLGDAAFLNAAAGGNGTGAVSYTSNTPSVASVDVDTGSVTIVGLGSAVITAAKAADVTHLAAIASYTLRVAPRTVDLTAWVGPSDAELTFGSQAAELNFGRSSDLNCDPEHLALCAEGTQAKLTDLTFTEPLANIHRPAMYWLEHGAHRTRTIVAPENKFARVIGKSVVAFKERLWVMASETFTPQELWSSLDGRNWRVETTDLPARAESRLLVFQDALWLIAGRSTSPYVISNEVWKSLDGKVWTSVPQAQPYPPRGFFAATAYNGRLWLSGGGEAGYDYNDVWYSLDGSTWQQATAAAPFAKREQHELIAFAGRLWVIGGYSSGVMYEDVWSSQDGATWTEETSTGEFGPRFAHTVVADSQRMWLIAGSDAYQSAQNDVRSTLDGKTWTERTRRAEFLPRNNAGAAVWNEQLWMIGPGDNDVWSSATGEKWSKNSLAAVIPRKYPAAAVGYKNRLWVLTEERRLWSSEDGFDWTEEVSELPGFSTVFGASGAQLLVFSNRLILIGGLQYSAPKYLREIWQSEDGRNWSKLVDAVPFTPDAISQAIEFDGKLWVVGGTSADPYASEVWSSADAVNWTRVTDKPAFAPRAAVRLVVYNGKLCAVGGISPSMDHSDVWESRDGITWNQVSASGLPARPFGPALSLNDKMCLYGSYTPFAMHDVWCSTDGLVWEKKWDDVPSGFLASLNGSAYFFGTSAAQNSSTDLVWRSADGISWRQGYRNVFRFD
ncbi:MAG: hypothetical protein ACJ8OJ_05905 [Povalibacter sp.]